MHRKRMVWGYLFSSVGFIGVLVVVVYPVLFGGYISLTKWDLLTAAKPFVGLKNYVYAFNQPLFLLSLKNTFYFVALNVPLVLIASLVLALLMQKKFRFRSIFRTVYFTPVVTSIIVCAIIWLWLFEASGVPNVLLKFLHLPTFAWIHDSKTVIPSVVLMTVWKSAGFGMIIFLAGLQGIPRVYYEAARIDGASNITLFFKITMPLLKPTMLFYVITTTISSFKMFAQIYTMTQGGPMNSSRVVVFHIYETAFKYLKMGKASAMAFILFGIILVITLISLKLFSRGYTYE